MYYDTNNYYLYQRVPKFSDNFVVNRNLSKAI